MTRLALLVALLASLSGGCSKKREARPKPAPQMPAEEVKRSEEACNTYAERICACATEQGSGSAAAELAKQCQLAKALPDAVRVGLEVAAHPDSKPEIVEQTLSSVRKTAKECIEQLGKLPALGCK